MAPDLFELFGIRAYGRGFEMVLWSLTMLIGALLLWRERVAGRSLQDGIFGWATGGFLLTFGLYRWLMVAFTDRVFLGLSGLIMPTYGVLMGLGFAVGIWLAWRLAARTADAMKPIHVIELSFWVVLSGLLGSRLLFMVTRIPHYIQICFDPADGRAPDCSAWLRFWEGGLVFYGGVLGALLGGWIWCRRSKVPFLVAADVTVYALAIGHAIGRLGCYAASCCFGARTDGPFAVFFPAYSSPYNQQLLHAGSEQRAWLQEHSHSLGVHAAQLYESAGELLIFLFIAVVIFPRRKFPGQVFATWLVGYGALRLVLEWFRGDAIRGFLFEWPAPFLSRLFGLPPETPLFLTTSQTVAIALISAGAALWWFGTRRARRECRELRGKWVD